MEIFMLVLSCLIGIAVGASVTNCIFYLRSRFGVLRIDHSNPDKDVYRLEIDKIDDISKKNRVVLKVDNNADLSQK